MDFLLRTKIGKVLRISVLDCLSRIFIEPIDDLGGFLNYFPNEQLFAISHATVPWFAYIVNCFAFGKITPHRSIQEKDTSFSQMRHYY